MPDRQLPHFLFEFLHGLGSHALGPTREHKPQKGITFTKARDLRFLSTQFEAELGQHLLHQNPRLLSLGACLGDHHKVVGISGESIAVLVQLPVQVIENDVGQQRRNDPSYTVDNFRFF